VLLCLLLRLVEAKDRRLVVLLRQRSFGNFLLFGLVMACPDPVALVSRNCPCDPEAVALLLLRPPPFAMTKAAAPVVVALDCPKDHSDLHLPVP
jgi:hypothetical protein